MVVKTAKPAPLPTTEALLVQILSNQICIMLALAPARPTSAAVSRDLLAHVAATEKSIVNYQKEYSTCGAL